ncbi:MAG: PD-(D/E)XK nuclease domain-containing protein [Succinivibrio sp.]|nr:PD-(D/E)XK nuclease domain-containing protein [Succinivibrio sp.]
MSQHYGQNLESAVVIELKQTKDRQKLKTLAVSALAQIEDKNYAAELCSKAPAVWAYGIAFCGKHCAVEAKKLQ